MSIKLRQIKKEIGAEALVVYATQTKVKGKKVLAALRGIEPSIEALAKQAFNEGSFLGSPNQAVIFRNYGDLGVQNLVFVGLGDSQKVTVESFRQATAAAYKLVESNKSKSISLFLDSAFLHLKNKGDVTQGICEGLILASYRFEDCKGTGFSSLQRLKTELVYKQGGGTASIKKFMEKGCILAEAVCFSRRLGDSPANLMTPDKLAKEAQKASQGTKLKVTIWDKARIQKEKMGGLIGVSLGSAAEPRFIAMEYKGAAASKKPVCFVGKAVTFDSGGLSIKPGPGMGEMKFDMCGGAVVIGAMCAIARLGLKINAIAFVPSSENTIGPKATRPGDVLRARNGKTVEVLNTDAEGRLILMDALSYASEKKPAAIFDVATLTGSVVVSLGNIYTGVFSRNCDLVERVQKAAQTTEEKVWPMPISDFHSEDMKTSTCADLRNISKGRGAGSSTAAAFLEEFVDKDIPWAHFDIAGTAWNCGNRLNYCTASGATGSLVRTFVEIARSF